MSRRLALLALFLGLLLVGSAQAQPPGSLFVVLLPGTSLSDWRSADAPNLHRLMATGALAVMNTRTARLSSDHVRETPESAVLTLGAGSRAAGGPEVTDFRLPQAPSVVPDVASGDLFTRRTGAKPTHQDFVNADWPRVLSENQGRGYDIRPGNLGDGLAQHGVTAMASGGPFSRPVACRGDGTVFPNQRVRSLSSFVCLIYDAGADVKSADGMIGTLVAQVNDFGGRLLVLSPFVGNAAYARNQRLAPVVLWGNNVPAGLLYSPSTHRVGLVANTDFAPTVTAYFGATAQNTWLPVRAFGGPWQIRNAPNALAFVSALEARAYRQSRSMQTLPYVALILGLLMGVGILLQAIGRPAPTLALFPAAVCLALIVSTSVTAFLLWGAVFSTGAGLFAKRYPVTKVVCFGMAVIAGLLVVDMVLGDPLMRVGMLGYSAVEGARYYGIGNEAMGALVGASLVAAAYLWSPSRGRQAFILLGLIVIASLLGLPTAGAKVGGLIVATSCFLTLVWQLWGGTLHTRAWAFVAGATLLVLTIVAALDVHGGGQTHLGRAVVRILSSGMNEAGDIIGRKLAVEVRLLYHSAWACPLWIGILGMLAVGPRRHALTRGRQALWLTGWTAIGLCLAVNDAGVVAAALCVSLLWSGLSAALTQKRPWPEEASPAIGVSR